MKTVLSIAGAIFILIGIAVGVVSQMDYGTVLIGLNLDLAATLIVGGFVVMGLSAVIGAVGAASMVSGLSQRGKVHTKGPANSPTMDGPKVGGLTAGAVGVGAAAGATAGALSTQIDKAGEGVDNAIDKVAEAAAQAKENSKDTVGNAVKATSETVAETGDKAKDGVDNLFASAKDTAKDNAGGAVEAVKDTASDATDAVSGTVKGTVDAVADKADDVIDAVEVPTTDEPVTEGADEASEDPDQLYVVEELIIRDRPARVLSDNTVEAETDEGWMRFENTEHLEEYLDAMSS